MKTYKFKSNGNVKNETNKENKEKIYKNKKYVELCRKIYKKYIYKHENIQIYRNVCRKIFM